MLFYGLPLPALGALFVFGVVPVVLLTRPANATLFVVALVFITGALEVAFGATGFGQAMFYRPTELLRIGSNEFGYVYRSNRKVTMKSPFGDLEAMGPTGIIEPREIEFITDGLGFRNRADYSGQHLFLVGDSFAMGEGETQACGVTEVLKAKYGVDIYNLAHSGDQPPDYVRHAESFMRRHPDARVVMMIFEGNDFEPYSERVYRQSRLRPYTEFFHDSNVYRVTRWLYVRAFKPSNQPKPRVEKIAGMPIAFEPGYALNAMRDQAISDEQMRFGQLFDRLKGRVAHVFFAPAKYRVYAPLLDGALHGKALPNRNWEYLHRVASERGIPVTDLSPALERAARDGLPRGEFVFWRGDTHWNCRGMAIAAEVMARALKR